MSQGGTGYVNLGAPGYTYAGTLEAIEVAIARAQFILTANDHGQVAGDGRYATQHEFEQAYLQVMQRQNWK